MKTLPILLYSPSLHTGGGTERVLVNLANELTEHGYNVSILTNVLGKNHVFTLHKDVFVKKYWLGALQAKYPSNLLFKIVNKFVGSKILALSLNKITNTTTPIISFSAANTNNCFKTKYRSSLISFEHYPFWAYNKFPKAQNEIISNYPKLKKVIVLTEHEYDVYKKLGCNVLKISNTYPFLPETPATLTEKKVLSVGHFNDAKRRDLLIEAWSYVHQQHPDWKLIIVGDGPYKEQCIRQIESLQLTDSIQIIEPTNNVVPYYLDASIFVLSSEFESFSLVLLEAKISGLPCVSFDIVCGPNELINEGKDGFLITFPDTKEMGSKISLLIENEELRKMFGKAGRADAITRFNPDKTYQPWLKFFKEWYSKV